MLTGTDHNEEMEEELAKKEDVMGELLRLALSLDYGDEIGRRKVFSVVSEWNLLPLLALCFLIWTIRGYASSSRATARPY